MGPLAGLIAALAAAQDEPVLVVEEPQEEVVVWGRLAVDSARDEIVREFEAIGFRVVRREEGAVVFRSRSSLVGKVTLRPDGSLDFTGAGVRATPAPVASAPVQSPNEPPIAGSGLSVIGPPSRAKVKDAEDEIRDRVKDEIASFRAIQQRTLFEEQLLTLPDRLDRLWADGTPIEPGPALASPDERRRAVLSHWATRADTVEGARVRETVEDWLLAVVQASDLPITDAERAEFEAQAGRPLPR
jgi:hypothetical protein